MLSDCDGAAALADTARKQSSTPYWDPPECPIAPPLGQRPQQDLQDTLTDTYKLGLVILRCLTPGKGAATSRSVDRLTGELDAAGVSLVTRALSANRTARPTARELYDYLYRVTSPRIAVPEVVFARLATPFRVRGQDVRIEWQINNAASVMISVGSTLRLQASLQRHPGGYVFRADQSGPVSIEVRNRFGTGQADLG